MLLAAGILFAGLTIPSYAKEYYVSQDGSTGFSTISAATKVAQEGDTVVIFPGTYQESVVIADKGINLIGLSMDDCILMNDTEDYYAPVLMLPSGSVQNLTIIAKQKEEGSVFIDAERDSVEEAEILKQLPHTSYAIHVESNYSAGRKLLIQNCRIVSECNHTIGVGLHDRFQLTFEDCEIEATAYSYPLFIHDSAAFYKGTSYVNFKNVTLHAPGRYAMALASYDGEYNKTYLSFEGLDISDTAGVYRITNVDGQKGDGFGGSESFYLATGISSDPSILKKKTNMSCSIWSMPATVMHAKLKSLPEGYEVSVFPQKIKSLLDDGKEYYQTIKGAYILCKCLDDVDSEAENGE